MFCPAEPGGRQAKSRMRVRRRTGRLRLPWEKPEMCRNTEDFRDVSGESCPRFDKSRTGKGI